jgi:hypothetical protein
MIDDLLEVTRLETGKLTVELECVPVSDAIADTFNTLQGTARAKGVTLSCDLPRDLPPVHADQTRLRQILIILIDNAIKFTPGGGTATIKVRPSPDDPRFLVLEVSDTGCGINPAMAERIFERLYQAAEPTHASRKGLGLGLYICKELVTRQGGRIWVEARPQAGSTFSFTLPVFSLKNVLAPLFKHDRWPAESVALVTVQTRLPGAPSSRESQEESSREARTLLQRCLLPDLDVLLPRLSLGPEGERFFVAAFTDEAGACVLVNRIREQFERLPQLKQGGTALEVSYRMLQPRQRVAGEPMDGSVTGMAACLEESITARLVPEAISHG